MKSKSGKRQGEPPKEQRQSPLLVGRRFFGAPPIVVLGIIISVFTLSLGDLMEIMPLFAPLMAYSLFHYFHEIHDLLSLGVAIYAAYKYHTRLGVAAILLFLVTHIPYAIIQSPKDALESLRILFIAITGFLGIGLIDRLHKSEETLSVSEERYRTLVENALIGVYRTNLKGDILYVNNALVSMLGFDSAKEMIAGGALVRYKSQSDRAILLKELTEKGKVNNFEFEVLTKTGKMKNVIMNTVLEGDTLSGMLLDITERKQAEERIAHLTAVLMGLRNVNQLITREKDRQNLIRKSCDLLVQKQSYEKAWILLLDENKSFVMVVSTGLGENAPAFLKQLETGNYPECVRELLSQEQSFLAYDQPGKRHNGCVLAGEHSSLGVFRYKLEYEGKLYGVLGIAVRSGVVFDKEEQDLFLELGGDISFALYNIEREEKSRQAEKALQESERLYRSLFENMLNGFAYCKMLFEEGKPSDFVYLSVNSAFETLTGLKNVAGKKVSEVIPEIQKSDPELFEIYGRVALTGIPERFETYVQAMEMWFSISVYSPGKEYFVAIFDVITQRKKAEEGLITSETRYRRLFESAKDGILIINAETGLIIDVNPFLQELLGFSRTYFLGKELWEIGTFKDIADNKDNFEELIRKGYVRYEDLPLKKADGRGIAVEFVSNVYEVDHLKVIQCNIRDITERKQTQEMLLQAAKEWQTTFDSIADPISIHDKDFKLVRVNEAFAEFLDKLPEDLIGQTCYKLMHGTSEPVSNCPYKKTIENKLPAEAEFFEPHLGRYLDVTTSPIFNDQGEVIACVHVTRDITERKKMDEQLMVTDRLASIGQLASGIAHELNNPLTGVIGFSELLLERDVPDDIREDLITINREAKRTAGVVKGLLTFARKQAVEKEAVDINPIIREVLQLRAYEQRVNNIEVKTRFAADLPEIKGNGAQLQQVFINLIVNAEQAMLEAHGRGSLTITTERAGGTVKASFADDGPGISPENMRKLFTPFFTTKEVGKGTGLGLSICHGIITEHGGRIYAESEPGKGTTFIIELPINKQ